LWKSFKGKVSIARQLSVADWLLLVEAWWVLLGFYLALHWVSLERMKNQFHLVGGKSIDLSGAQGFAHRLHYLVSLAAHLHLFSVTCLNRASTIHWMLTRRGIESRLCIGMNRSQDGIHAHAWVEIMGQPIGESEDIDERFKVLHLSTD
jgi:hypothetical protein